jgi:hypothetical protein
MNVDDSSSELKYLYIVLSRSTEFTKCKIETEFTATGNMSYMKSFVMLTPVSRRTTYKPKKRNADRMEYITAS